MKEPACGCIVINCGTLTGKRTIKEIPLSILLNHGRSALNSWNCFINLKPIFHNRLQGEREREGGRVRAVIEFIRGLSLLCNCWRHFRCNVL